MDYNDIAARFDEPLAFSNACQTAEQERMKAAQQKQRETTLDEKTKHRTPRHWPAPVAAAALRFVTRKTFFDFTGPAATRDAGEEGAEEIVAATLCRVMAGPDIPAGVPLKRWLARACRYARLTRGYDSGLERKRERHHLELEEALSGPYKGASMDARQVDPARALAAAEDAIENGIFEAIPHHASERMKYRKTRRTYHYQTMRGGPIYRRVVILGAVWHRVQIATQVTIEKTARSPEGWTGSRWNNHAEAGFQHWQAEKAEVGDAKRENRPAEPIPFMSHIHYSPYLTVAIAILLSGICDERAVVELVWNTVSVRILRVGDTPHR